MENNENSEKRNAKCLVFLYKRTRKEVDDKFFAEKFLNTESNVSYEYKPLEIISGQITNEDGKYVFISDDNKYKLHLIDNTETKDEEFGFAFPLDVTGYNEDDIKEYIEVLKTDKLFSQNLFQIYTEYYKDNGLYTFTYSDEKDVLILDTLNYDNSCSLVYSDLKIKDYKKQAGITNRLIINTNNMSSNTDTQEEVKEEASIESKPHKAVKCSNDTVYADELYDEIRKYVISQDEQIKAIATIFAKNQRIDNTHLKCNFILCGPTGVGKTEIFRQLAKIANVPMVTVDANEFTASGYVGRIVTEPLVSLYVAADGDIKKAENGIIYWDEIDKKAGRSNDMEVSKGAVIQALLKMIEGHVYSITIGKKQIYFDTSRVTFAFSGAFSGIEEFAKPKNKNNGIGFGASVSNEELTKEEKYNTYTLCKYGLLPEFVGRNRIIAMKDLNQKDLEKILKTGELSYLRLYREYLNGLNMKFKYSNAVIRTIAEKAIEEKTGARSLQTITEKALEVADYYIGSRNGWNYKELIITPKTIEDNKKFILR